MKKILQLKQVYYKEIPFKTKIPTIATVKSKRLIKANKCLNSQNGNLNNRECH